MPSQASRIRNDEFDFYLGGFIPTTENQADWASKWRTVGSAAYDVPNERYSNNTQLLNNNEPFRITDRSYIWRCNGTLP